MQAVACATSLGAPIITDKSKYSNEISKIAPACTRDG